jgi:hypothetical protein
VERGAGARATGDGPAGRGARPADGGCAAEAGSRGSQGAVSTRGRVVGRGIAGREGKVGILARVCHRVRDRGKPVFTLKQRRVVACGATSRRCVRASSKPRGGCVAERRRRRLGAGIPRARRGLPHGHPGLLPRGLEGGVERRTLVLRTAGVAVGTTTEALRHGR